MKPLRITLFSLLGTASLMAGENPADNPDQMPPRPGQRHGFFAEFIAKADTDKDGAVTPAEFAAMERVANLPEDKRDEIFRRFDKNGDGLIKHDDMPPRGEPGRRPPIDLPKLDEDHDGSVSYEEFLKSEFVQKLPEDRQRKFFERLDRNSDGKLSPDDRPERGRGRRGRDDKDRDPRDLIRRLDENKDGSVSFEEFRKAPWVAQLGEDEQEDRFEEMDRNDDLKLDASDFPPPPRDKPDGPPPPPEQKPGA